MAKTAAKRAQPRMSGGGRRRSSVDSRQMELFSAPASEAHIAPRPELTSALAPPSFQADLFEAARVDAQRAAAPVPTRFEAEPAGANVEIDGEALVLVAISDLIRRLWLEETGKDLYASPAGPQNSYRGKASMARVKAGQPASPSSA